MLIEDAAQAVGARIDGRPAGAVGRYGVLSFGRGKGVTGGRGGALLANMPMPRPALEALGTALTAGAAAPAPRPCWPNGCSPGPRCTACRLRCRFSGWAKRSIIHRARPATCPRSPSAFLAEHADARAGRGRRARTHARRLLDIIGSWRAPRLCGAAGTEPGYLRLPLLVGGSAFRRAAADRRRLGVWPSYPQSLADLPGFGERRTQPAEASRARASSPGDLVTLPTHGRLQARDLEALERWIGGSQDPRSDDVRCGEGAAVRHGPGRGRFVNYANGWVRYAERHHRRYTAG